MTNKQHLRSSVALGVLSVIAFGALSCFAAYKLKTLDCKSKSKALPNNNLNIHNNHKNNHSSKSKKSCTISMNNSLIWNPSKDSKNPNFAFTENSINYLKSLSEFFELHLIFKVDSDKQQEQIQSILKNTGLFFDKDEDFLSQQEQSEIENNSDSYIIDSRRILFCSTEKGKIHLVRHIKPFLHIDSNKEDVIELSPYVEKLIFCKKTKLPNNQHHSLHSKEDYNINTCSNGLKLQVNQSNTGKGLVGLSRTNSYNTLLVNNNKQQQHNTKENGRISNTSSDSDSDDNFFDGTLNVEVIDLAEFRLEE